MIPLSRVLDRLVSTPALIRKLPDKGVVKVKDGRVKIVEISFEKTQAGYINFSNADETLQLKIPRAKGR